MECKHCKKHIAHERDEKIEDFLVQHFGFDTVAEFMSLREDVRAIPDVDPGEVFFAVSVDPYAPESEDRRTTRIKTPAVRDTLGCGLLGANLRGTYLSGALVST